MKNVKFFPYFFSVILQSFLKFLRLFLSVYLFELKFLICVHCNTFLNFSGPY